MPAVPIADAAEIQAGWVDPELVQGPQRTRHQALAAGLVDRRRPRVDDGHHQAGAGREQRGGKAGGSGSGHQYVDHDGAEVRGDVTAAGADAASVRAAFSAVIRTRSSQALSTVKTTAVIHAVCTIGRAMPSTTTAT